MTPYLSKRILPVLWSCVIAACLVALLLGTTVADPVRTTAQTGFAAQIAALSEPPGFFDTDNLVSNERSYLQVLPDLERARVRGGAYLGVGPDQNFSYIAAIRPAIAFIVDIRRDNLLLHLLFKALFDLSRTRAEYLSILFGRPLSANPDTWRDAPIERLVSIADGDWDRKAIERLRERVDEAIRRSGVPLSREDFATIDRFHRRFIESGLGLKFQSYGRPPQSFYPSYRDLLLETDAQGRHGNYLASEEGFQFLKSLQARDLIVPVVGDLSGSSAITNIAAVLRQRGDRVSAFYVSNVEDYLFRDGRFPRFVQNLGRLPHDDRSLLIRSIFGPWTSGLRPGDLSASRTQLIKELLADVASGHVQSYRDLIAR